LRGRRPALAPLIGALISVVSLAAVVWWILRQDAPTLPGSGAGFAFLAGALGLIALTLLLRGWRWHRIMTIADIRHRRRDAQGLTVVGYMGNNVLPARGGELLKVGLLGARTDSRRREVLGSVIAERLLDAGALVLMFGALTWVGVAGAPTGRGYAAVAIGVLAAAAVALTVYLWLRRRGRFERFALVVRPVARASKLFARPEGAPLALISVLIWCMEGVSFVLMARAIEIDIALPDAILVVVLASLFAAIPAAPGFAGTFDAGLLLGLHASSIDGGGAVGLLLLARFMYFVPVTVAGLIVLLAGYGGVRLRLRSQQLQSSDPSGLHAAQQR
jgi:glycosyltransferase 2 family protein